MYVHVSSGIVSYKKAFQHPWSKAQDDWHRRHQYLGPLGCSNSISQLGDCPVPWSFWISIVWILPLFPVCEYQQMPCALSLWTQQVALPTLTLVRWHSTCSVLSCCHISRGPGCKPVVCSNWALLKGSLRDVAGCTGDPFFSSKYTENIFFSNFK